MQGLLVYPYISTVIFLSQTVFSLLLLFYKKQILSANSLNILYNIFLATKKDTRHIFNSEL
jgi:hypothetical protein